MFLLRKLNNILTNLSGIVSNIGNIKNNFDFFHFFKVSVYFQNMLVSDLPKYKVQFSELWITWKKLLLHRKKTLLKPFLP